MEELTAVITCAGGGYALGSVSFSLVLARSQGVDLRKVGSGNLGATNLGRALGRRYAVAAYLLDMLKGCAPALLALLLWPVSEAAAVAAGAGAIFGHVWPLWHGFRGGKGVATLSGAMLALLPLGTLTAGLAWLFTVRFTRWVSLGSIAFGLALPLAAWAWNRSALVIAFAAAGGVFLIFTHRSNLMRILRGEEHRVGKKPSGDES
jgi:glycerol-3-phosphate acyltransferase PlsY